MPASSPMDAATVAIRPQDHPLDGQTAEPGAPAPAKSKRASFFRDPLSLVLLLVTVVALVLAGLIGTELYARHLAIQKVAEAATCEVEDGATVKFGFSPPFLWQHITGHYTNISIHTDGNQVKDAKLMTADLTISDVRLHDTGDSGGSIGALDATLTWPSDGIKQTIQELLPKLATKLDSRLGGLIAKLALVQDVTTSAADGTVTLTFGLGLGTATIKPVVQNNTLMLQLVEIGGLAGLLGPLTTENLQPILDKFASELTNRYPMGIHADSVQVTDDGVVARFSTRDASLPSHSQNPCFANL